MRFGRLHSEWRSGDGTAGEDGLMGVFGMKEGREVVRRDKIDGVPRRSNWNLTGSVIVARIEIAM